MCIRDIFPGYLSGQSRLEVYLFGRECHACEAPLHLYFVLIEIAQRPIREINVKEKNAKKKKREPRMMWKALE